VLQPVYAHRQVGQGGHHQAAEPRLDGVPGAALLPDDGHPLDGHRDDHHGEQGDGKPGLDAELVEDDADEQHQEHHDDEHGREPRHQQQAEALEQEAYGEPEGDQQREQEDAADQLRLAEGQRDQHGHERAEGLHADEVAHEYHHQRADGNHQQHGVDRLGADGQAEQGELHQPRAALLRALAGHIERVQLIFLHRQVHLEPAAALHGRQRLSTPPPDQVIVGQALLARARVEAQPAQAVVDLQPGNDIGLPGLAAQHDAPHHAGGNACSRQYLGDRRDEPCAGFGQAEQQFDVVSRRGVVQPVQQFGGERGGIRRLLAHLLHQHLQGRIERLLQRGRRRERRRGVGLTAGRVLVEHGAVVQRLRAVGAPDRPLGLAAAAVEIDAEAVALRYRVLGQQGVARRERG